MAFYNYIRPTWKSGPHAVSDAPRWISASIERTLEESPLPDDERIAMLSEGQHGLTIAVVQSASPPSQATTADTAPRFLHALASDDFETNPLTEVLAQTLFEDIYGAPLAIQLSTQSKTFLALDHPHDRDSALALFVGKDRFEENPEVEPIAYAPRGVTPLARTQGSTDPPEPAEVGTGLGKERAPLSALISNRSTGGVPESAASMDLEYAFATRTEPREVLSPGKGPTFVPQAAPLLPPSTEPEPKSPDTQAEQPPRHHRVAAPEPTPAAPLVHEPAAPRTRLLPLGLLLTGLALGVIAERSILSTPANELSRVQLEIFSHQIETYREQSEFYAQRLASLEAQLAESAPQAPTLAAKTSQENPQAAPVTAQPTTALASPEASVESRDSTRLTAATVEIAPTVGETGTPAALPRASAVPSEVQMLSDPAGLFVVQARETAEVYATPTLETDGPVTALLPGEVYTVTREVQRNGERWYEIRHGWLKLTPRLTLTSEAPPGTNRGMVEPGADPQVYAHIHNSMNLRSAPSTAPDVEVVALADGEVLPVSGRLSADDGLWFELRRGWVRASPVLTKVDDLSSREASLNLRIASGLEALPQTEPTADLSEGSQSGSVDTVLGWREDSLEAPELIQPPLPAVSANAPTSKAAEAAVPWDEPREQTPEAAEEAPAAESVDDPEAGLEPDEIYSRKRAEEFKQMRYRR